MEKPLIVVRPWIEFRSSLPTDTIETETEIVQVGGKTVAEEIGKILRRLSCEVEEPEYADEHGWVFNATVADRNLYCQVTDVDHFLVLIKDSPVLGWFRKRPNLVYFDVLTDLAEELDRDPRFWDIVWHTQETVMSNQPGAARPVGDHPPLLVHFESLSLVREP